MYIYMYVRVQIYAKPPSLLAMLRDQQRVHQLKSRVGLRVDCHRRPRSGVPLTSQQRQQTTILNFVWAAPHVVQW